MNLFDDVWKTSNNWNINYIIAYNVKIKALWKKFVKLNPTF